MDKNIYPFKKSDGFVSPCIKGCPNCKNCTDVFWDYSNGIYECLYSIHKDPDVCCEDYVNDGTEPISIKEFNKIKVSEELLRNDLIFGTFLEAVKED